MKIVFLVMLLMFVMAHAQADKAVPSSPIQAKLSLWTLNKDGEAQEKMDDVSYLNPGDNFIYKVEYLNTSAKTLGDIKATLPIPEAIHLVRVEQTKNLFARTQRSDFSAWPLTSKKTNEHGERVAYPTPLSEIAGLRWNVERLAPREKVEFIAVVTLSAQ